MFKPFFNRWSSLPLWVRVAAAIAGFLALASVLLAGLFGWLEIQERAAVSRMPRPYVATWKPGPITDAPISTTIEMWFSTPLMDYASVQAAFHITPAVPGQLIPIITNSSGDAYQGGVLFKPERALDKATRYQITLDASARHQRGMLLAVPFSAAFTTTGGLRVTWYPLGASNVATTTHIGLTFNATFTPQLPLDLIFTPPVTGKGHWANAARYEFNPDTLQPATRYTVRLPAGLIAASGEKLFQDALMTFTTTLPTVADYAPVGKLAPTATNITLTFNLPMDQSSVEQKFAVRRADGQPVPGKIVWVKPTVLVFKPTRLLSDGATYSITVQAGALSTAGKLPVERTWAQTFTTAPLPELISSAPADGDLRAKPTDRITLRFNVPMNRGAVEKSLRILPEPQAPLFKWSKDNTALDIIFSISPDKLYTVALDNSAVDAWGRVVRGNRSIVFQNAPLDPQVWLVGPRGYWNQVYGTYNPNPQVRQYTQFRNVKSLTYRLSSIKTEDFMANFRPNWYSEKKPPVSTLILTWTQSVTAPVNKLGLASTEVALPDGSLLPSGVYMLEVEGKPGTNKDWRILIVSPINLALKRSNNQTFVWATDLRTGQPVAGLPLRVYDQKKQLVTQGATNAVGVFKTADTPTCSDWWECAYGWSPLYVIAESALPSPSGRGAGGEGEGLWGFVASTWDEGIATRDFRMPYYYGEPSHTVFLYTDRPLYRPDQTVYFKGVARQDDDGRYSLPKFARVPVVILDAQGNEIYNEELPVSEMGTFYGEIKLNAEAALGSYTIKVRYAEDDREAYGNFRVAEYRKPEFKVNVTPSAATPIHGETVTVVVQADYYFGAPMPNAAVEWRLSSDNFRFSLPNEWYSFSGDMSEYYWLWGKDADYGQNIYANGTGKTDANGTFTFTVRLDLSKAKYSQVLTFQAEVIDQNNQVTSARGYAVAHKSKLYVGARPRWYVTRPQEFLDIQLVAADPDKKLLPGVPLTVELYEREWKSARVRDEYGIYRWQSGYSDTLLFTQTVTTGADGRVVAVVTPPRGGEYKVLAKGKFAGSEAVAATFFWTWGGEYVNWGIQNDDRINVIADKRTYQPGETARLLITAPFADSAALVSVERGGVLRYWTLPIKSTSALIQVPIHADYAPNAFVSVILLKGQAADFPAADFKLGYAALNVELTQQRLNVELIPDRKRYAPRDTVLYTVRVTDYQSRPVDAEVSLSLIDAAVLALVGDEDRDILSAFYRQRGLGVHNSLTLVTSVDRLTAILDKKAKGGGGGGEIATRELFADTAFWRAAVRTGPSGETTIAVPLPDNLTTWRMRAKAVSADTRLGQSEVDVIATQDILVRPVLPRFFTVGDQAHIGAIVHNYTPVTETLQTVLEYIAYPGGLQDTFPPGSKTSRIQEVTIGPNGSAPVYWDVSIPRTLSVTLRMQAAARDGRGDAVKLTLPVNAYFDSIAYSTYLAITNTATITATLPRDVVRSMDELVIEVEPSIAASIDSGLEYLVQFPYGCVEQTMSSFLPDVVVMRLIKQLSLDIRPGFRNQLDAMIESGMQRLYGYQHNDGGWGWWKDDQSNPSITAYVLYGLHQMELGGRPIDKKVRDAATGYLLKWLQHTAVDAPIGPVHGAEKVASGANVRAYALYVLAELGQGNPGLTGRLYEQRDKLDHYGKAYLALALYINNDRKIDARIETLLQDLRDAAEKQGGTVYWQDRQPDYWGMSTGARTTAIALNAFVQLFIADPTIDPAARWLLMQRREGRWGTTQETSMSLVALVEYLTATFERDGDYTYTIRINGQEIATQAVTPQTLGKRGKWVIPLAGLSEGNPVIEITRNAGPGAPVRATISLRHYRSGDDIAPIKDQGVFVRRTYDVGKGKKLDNLQPGDIVTVSLMVELKSGMAYMLVEDPLPAGLEPIDTSLATTGKQYQGVSDDWVWNRVELRDDRMALFATWLPGGKARVYTYLARATTSGTFYALPLQAYAMYKPDIIGRTAGTVVKIR